MFQPRVKLEFVRRYCHPRNGWHVFVDIDPSEEGRTGGQRRTREAAVRQREMQTDAERVRRALLSLGVAADGGRAAWYRNQKLPRVDGDRDIVAFEPTRRLYLIAEVEGASAGQPEQKLYKAVGQLVIAASATVLDGWKRSLVLVVHGEEVAGHLARAHCLERIGVAGLVLASRGSSDRWVFGAPIPQVNE